MSDCGSGARNSFCSYLARIQRSFSSLRVQQSQSAHTPGRCHGVGAPALPFEHAACHVQTEHTARQCHVHGCHRGSVHIAPLPTHARHTPVPTCGSEHLHVLGYALTPTATTLQSAPSGPPRPAPRSPACPRHASPGTAGPIPHPAGSREGRLPRSVPRERSAVLSPLPSRLRRTKAVAASVPPGAAGPPDRCAPCRRYLLPFYPSASGGRPSMPRAEHAHCRRPLTRSYPLISGRMGSCWDE